MNILPEDVWIYLVFMIFLYKIRIVSWLDIITWRTVQKAVILYSM